MVINITNQTRFVVSRFLLKLVPSHCWCLFVRPHSTFAPEVGSNPKTPQSQEEHVAFCCLQSIKQTRLAWWLPHSLLKTVWSPSFVVWSLTNFKTTQPQHRKWIQRPKLSPFSNEHVHNFLTFCFASYFRSQVYTKRSMFDPLTGTDKTFQPQYNQGYQGYARNISLIFALKKRRRKRRKRQKKTSNGITIRVILKHFMNLSYPCFAISP